MHDLSRVEDGPVVYVSEGFDYEGFRRLGFALYLVSVYTLCRSSRPMSQRLASGKHVARYSEMELTTLWLDDMLNRRWDASAGKITTSSGSISAAATFLDIYICGFLCTPFTSNGLRQVCFGAGHGRKWFALVAVVFVLVVFSLRPHPVPVPNTGMGGRSIEDVLGYNQDHRLPSPSMFCAGERRRYFEQFQFGRG